MILKLKSFFLQNGGSYLSLPNAFDLKKKKSFDKNEKNSEKETLKEIQSKNIETVQLKKKQLEKTKKSYLAIKYPEFELRKKELKDLKKRKRNEKEMTLLYRPIQKIKKI